ncbi:cysteine synthase family protein [Oxalobacter aliiformigenes]|uniref:PLP-dependent cysteine synthase family protein n=1 Tax=Oxalobacter aliiformigenes TaxID=2946593 RepID=UPI0022AF2E15|nr:cysteine synthase family protein [Oxalobacter aliiformigenes]MCZ4064401.1 cysteine synthase family protein [Oxalobacter aliiformigenes]WAV99751.1 cysteine synthase family protein [Oxalobacter aliiformigenes]
MTGIFRAVGNTPLLRLQNLAGTDQAAVYAKAEYLNPSGSGKDRAALSMIREGIESGKLSPEKTILDATSGNTGIAYAMLGAVLGYRVKLYMPANASIERKKVIRAYGAEIVETDPLEGSDGAYLGVLEEVRKDPDRYFYPDQYNNPANWLAHYNGTGREIFSQTSGRVTHFIAGMGTSGTLMGVARRLKKENPDIRIIGIQPDSPMHGIEGTKHMGSTIPPGIYDSSVIDEFVEVRTEDAYEMVRKLAEQEGMFVGISSGANVSGAITYAAGLSPDSVVVTILCDNGFRYLSEDLWR